MKLITRIRRALGTEPDPPSARTCYRTETRLLCGPAAIARAPAEISDHL